MGMRRKHLHTSAHPVSPSTRLSPHLPVVLLSGPCPASQWFTAAQKHVSPSSATSHSIKCSQLKFLLRALPTRRTLLLYCILRPPLPRALVWLQSTCSSHHPTSELIHLWSGPRDVLSPASIGKSSQDRKCELQERHQYNRIRDTGHLWATGLCDPFVPAELPQAWTYLFHHGSTRFTTVPAWPCYDLMDLTIPGSW